MTEIDSNSDTTGAIGPAEFATLLEGATYNDVVGPELIAVAKAQGLVIVYGQSDDLMEFRGAIHDEVGAYDGTTAWIDKVGLLPARDDIDVEDDDVLRDFFERKPQAVSIEALWSSEGEYSWTYRTDIPHATFEVIDLDESEPYCRGIVFALADIPPTDVKQDPACQSDQSDQSSAMEKLEWAAASHITREYRTVTLGENEARELLATFRNALEDSRRYQKLCADAEARDMGWLMTDALRMGAGAIEMHCDAEKEPGNG